MLILARCIDVFTTHVYAHVPQELYLDVFYRDVAAFVLGFGAVHLELCFSLQQRTDAFDAFFDVTRVPAASILDALTTTLAHTTARGSDSARQDDAKATIAQCVRLLEVGIDAHALEAVVTELLALQVRISTVQCADASMFRRTDVCLDCAAAD